MKVLLSIKPQFADLIFDGTKRFEFRRSIFKEKGIKTVVVYASSPTQKVIGEFEIDSILEEEVAKLWKKTKAYSGIDRSYFYEYFSDKKNGYAIKIKNVKKYETPLCLKEHYNLTPPQSFAYLK